ncbi:hypothetical protein Q4Q34_13185 [Flavivirga abyssicola]|uniref:toxin-antitoxin system YwqK family antitoxin n=1 Tax=Flavivirga abyssicola TaxID=3063533 RepID=UPI0026DEDEDC|nr:hypothetical protein [Flavivirga sp. MEBiC07777]WVK12173.1 hypothetical protein Q4Q34_13185 [Flavivirga sp. MEBiC07777]
MKHVIVNTNEHLELINGVMFFNEIPLTGNIMSYYENHKVKSDIQYDKGKKHGYEKHWYENGLKKIERRYFEGFKTALHKGWWPDGKLKFEYHFNKKGEYDGVIKEWYKTGQLFRDFKYMAGKEVGSQRLWKVNGTIKANYEVVNGERFGLIGLKKCYTVTANNNEIK